MASDPAQRGIPSPPNSEVRVGRAPHDPPAPPRPEDEHASSARSAHKGAGTTAPSGDPGLVATCPLPSDEWQDPLSAERQCAPHHRKNNTSARRIAELIKGRGDRESGQRIDSPEHLCHRTQQDASSDDVGLFQQVHPPNEKEQNDARNRGK